METHTSPASEGSFGTVLWASAAVYGGVWFGWGGGRGWGGVQGVAWRPERLHGGVARAGQEVVGFYDWGWVGVGVGGG